MSNAFPVKSPNQLERTPPDRKWLIEGVWAAEAGGFLAGKPKTCKTWLCLQMAISVASGIDFLDKFKVNRKGRVLVFPAEDSESMIRERLELICKGLKVDIS